MQTLYISVQTKIERTAFQCQRCKSNSSNCFVGNSGTANTEIQIYMNSNWRQQFFNSCWQVLVQNFLQKHTVVINIHSNKKFNHKKWSTKFRCTEKLSDDIIFYQCPIVTSGTSWNVSKIPPDTGRKSPIFYTYLYLMTLKMSITMEFHCIVR